MSLRVRPVASRSDVRAFIELPFRLHSSSAHWVPPLRLERHLFLSRRFNAFFRRGAAQLFVAERDGRVVGRISAQIDDLFNAHHGNRWGMFGFLEVEDDALVLDGLLDAAGEWLRVRGRDRMVGPMDFTMNDESGVLIDGYDLPPIIRQPWHPPYYRTLCEAAGLRKAVDLQTWSLDVSDRSRVRPAVFAVAERARTRHGITIRHMTRRSLRRDLDAFAAVYNAAWSRNWGFVPYGPEDLDHYAQELQLVFDRHWFMVAERQGEVIAVGISMPDANQILRRMNGRVLPFGWWHYLRRSRTIDRVRVGFLGVMPGYEHTGVAAALYEEHFDMAEVTPQRAGEAGWILETNHSMNRSMESMGGRVVKRFRVYERTLDGSPSVGGPR